MKRVSKSARIMKQPLITMMGVHMKETVNVLAISSHSPIPRRSPNRLLFFCYAPSPCRLVGVILCRGLSMEIPRKIRYNIKLRKNEDKKEVSNKERAKEKILPQRTEARKKYEQSVPFKILRKRFWN